jgi:hypothetical protein
MARKKVKKEKEKLNFEDIHNSFKGNLESLEVFVNSVAPVAEKHDEATREKLVKFANGIRKIFGAEKDKLNKKRRKQLIEGMTEEQANQLIQLAADLPRLTLPQAQLLYRSSFVMLMSYFDFLLSDLIHYFYRKYPEDLSGKNLSLTLSELRHLGDMDTAVDFIINKEIDNILYDKLEKQKLYFRDTLKVDTKDDIINWNKIVEAMERRHIVVHNDCKINRRYLSNVDLSVIPEPIKDVKEGTEVRITAPYFRGIFEEVCVSGVVLLQVCWRKWEKDDTKNADNALINLDIYDALIKENWTCAERLGLFAKGCAVADQASHLILDVNYCQSLKWQGKKDKLEKELVKFDVSALRPKFALALYALKSDSDGFYRNIENAIIVDKMAKKDFMEWPLFRELREAPTYGDKIDAAFAAVSRASQAPS